MTDEPKLRTPEDEWADLIIERDTLLAENARLREQIKRLANGWDESNAAVCALAAKLERLTIPPELRELSERATGGEWALPSEHSSTIIDKDRDFIADIDTGQKDASFICGAVNFLRSLIASGEARQSDAKGK